MAGTITTTNTAAVFCPGFYAAGGSLGSGGHNAKSELSAFCQWRTRRSMGKIDIAYNVIEQGGRFQATVTMKCFGDVEKHVGEFSSTDKLAMQEAAARALEAHGDEWSFKQRGELPPGRSPKQKISRRIAQRRQGKENKEGNASNREKALGVLHVCVREILGRDSELGTDIVFDNVLQASGGYVSTLRLPTIPEPLSQMQWVGELTEKERGSKIHAALTAINALLRQPPLAAVLNPDGQSIDDWWDNNRFINRFNRSRQELAAASQRLAPPPQSEPSDPNSKSHTRTVQRRKLRQRAKQKLEEQAAADLGLKPKAEAEPKPELTLAGPIEA